MAFKPRFKLTLRAPARWLGFTLAALGGSLAQPAFVAPAHAGQSWPQLVQANYRIEFNGFDVGTFDFQSNIADGTYTISGDARLSALLGAFKWHGATRASGALAGDAPRPAGYTFDYAGTGKQGSIKMGFRGDGINSLSHVPPYNPTPETVRVREPHLKGVLDPLSAVMALARSDDSNPCNRRLPLFDGKQRFDLAFSYKRQENVAEQRPSGQPGVAVVCKVRYIPIAGHKDNDETRAMSTSGGIEVALRPIPSARLFVPHRISIPTGAGTVSIIAQRIHIVTTHNEQIALSH